MWGEAEGFEQSARRSQGSARACGAVWPGALAGGQGGNLLSIIVASQPVPLSSMPPLAPPTFQSPSLDVSAALRALLFLLGLLPSAPRRRQPPAHGWRHPCFSSTCDPRPSSSYHQPSVVSQSRPKLSESRATRCKGRETRNKEGRRRPSKQLSADGRRA